MIYKSRMFLSIFVLVVIGFLVSAVASFKISESRALESVMKEDLPLIIDNAHANIQLALQGPRIISSLMAKNLFLQYWVAHELNKVEELTEYLQVLTNEYMLDSAFFVLDKNLRYYTGEGHKETKLQESAPNNWYFRFKNSDLESEGKLGIDEVSKETKFFINFKVRDKNNKLVGITGISLDLNVVQERLQSYSEKYDKNVYLLNKDGMLILSDEDKSMPEKYAEIVKNFALNLSGNKEGLFSYTYNNEKYLIVIRYIKELGVYLCVDVAVKNVTEPLLHSFIITLVTGSLLLLVILFLILKTIHIYQQKLEDAAWHDSLTGLLNRRCFINKFKKEASLHHRKNKNMVLLMIDIDFFKRVNDIFGHACGDQVLICSAKILSRLMRTHDVSARWGGEEFMFLLPMTTLEGAVIVAERFRVAIQNDSELISLTEKGITISIGLQAFNSDQDMNWHVEAVDMNLYKAKDAGRNCIIY